MAIVLSGTQNAWPRAQPPAFISHPVSSDPGCSFSCPPNTLLEARPTDVCVTCHAAAHAHAFDCTQPLWHVNRTRMQTPRLPGKLQRHEVSWQCNTHLLHQPPAGLTLVGCHPLVAMRIPCHGRTARARHAHQLSIDATTPKHALLPACAPPLPTPHKLVAYRFHSTAHGRF